jgi:hypothetical protein
MSVGGDIFSELGKIPKNMSLVEYQFNYATQSSEMGKYFFRIKQVCSDGYTGFNKINSIELESSTKPATNIYHNPYLGYSWY